MRTDAFWICLMVGWVFMIGSWVLPLLTKNERLKSLYGLGLSALSTGVYIAIGIYQFVK